MNPRIEEVKYESPYRFVLTFSINETKEFDFSSYLHYPVYESLRDETLCKKARPFNGTVIWDDTIDFNRDLLYLESKTWYQKYKKTPAKAWEWVTDPQLSTSPALTL